MPISNTYVIIVTILALALLALNAKGFKLSKLRPARQAQIIVRENLSQHTTLIMFALHGREYVLLESAKHLTFCDEHSTGVLPGKKQISLTAPSTERRPASDISFDGKAALEPQVARSATGKNEL
jgi:hypothetical protein